jgi:hypothetical protein
MGTNIGAAHKVFVDMAERKIFSNFGKSFGGSHSYNHRDIMVVVVLILVKVCKNSKSWPSSLCFNVITCLLYSGQPSQHEVWWST